MQISPMTRAEQALHSLTVEFMSDAPPGEYFELPGGKTEGQRIPDFSDDERGIVITGSIVSRPL